MDVEVIWERECVYCVGRLQALWPGRDFLVLLPPGRSRCDKFAWLHFSNSNRYIPERTRYMWRHTLSFVCLKHFRWARHKVCPLFSSWSSEHGCSTTVRSFSWWLPLDMTETSREKWICSVAAVRSWSVAQNSEVGFGTIQLTKQTRFHNLMTAVQPHSETFSTKPMRWKTSIMSANICLSVIFHLPCIPDSQFFQVSVWCPSGIWRRAVWCACTDVSDQPAASIFAHFLSRFYPECRGSKSPLKRLTDCTKIHSASSKYHSCYAKCHGNVKYQYFQVKSN